MTIADNIIIANRQLATQIDGSATSAALNNYKSSFITAGATISVVCASTAGLPYLVMVFLPEEIGSCSMTINGVTVSDTSIGNTLGIAQGAGKYLVYTGIGATSAISITGLSSKKVSKILVSNYLQLQYNVPYGFSAGYEDLSNMERSQAGDAIVSVGVKYKSMSIPIQHISQNDKLNLYNILKECGKSTPLFVSVMPTSEQERKQMYSIYGYLDNSAPITADNILLYSTSVSINEF